MSFTMKFDLNQSSKGEWFPFFGSEVKPDGSVQYLDPEKNAGKVCLRICDTEALESIQAQTRTKKSEFVRNPVERKMERVTYFDQTPEQMKKEQELIWDHAIIAWENLLDKEGKPIPCTLENKLKLMNHPQFARFMGRCMEIMTGAAAEAEKVKEKN